MGLFWSAQLGAVHVLGMYTESALDVAAMGDAQLEWIRRDLARHICQGLYDSLSHRPLYCSNTGGNDVPAGNKVAGVLKTRWLRPTLTLWFRGTFTIMSAPYRFALARLSSAITQNPMHLSMWPMAPAVTEKITTAPLPISLGTRHRTRVVPDPDRLRAMCHLLC